MSSNNGWGGGGTPVWWISLVFYLYPIPSLWACMYMLISELMQCTCMCSLYNNNIYTHYCAWFSTQLQSVSVKHGCNTGYYWKQQRNALDIRCNKSNNRFYFKLCQKLNRYTVIRKYKIIIEILQSLWNEQGV